MRKKHFVENQIAHATNFEDMFNSFLEHIEILKNHTFLFFDDALIEDFTGKIPEYMNRVSDGFCITTLSNQTGFLVLNKKRIECALENKKFEVPFKFGYKMDVQMMNLLHKYFYKKPDLPTEAKKIFDFCLERKVSFDCKPYLTENCLKIKENGIREHMRETLLPFSDFFNSDNVSDTNHVFSKKIHQNVEYLLTECEKSNEIIKIALDGYRTVYCLLLETVLISGKKNLSITKKMEKLLAFVNFQLGVYNDRELLICYWFLKNRNDPRITKFFKKIQPNSKDIIKTIQGMAWDLTHLRDLTNSSFMARESARHDKQPYWRETIYIDSLVTRDRGLTDIIMAHPIRCLIFEEDKLFPRTVWKTPAEAVIEEIDIVEILSDNEHLRRDVRQRRDFDVLIPYLEREVKGIYHKP